MFWIDTLTDYTEYCTCQGRWMSFRIISAHVDRNVLEVFMTPELGKRCLVYRVKRGCDESSCEILFNITPWEHVKIEVVGGEITIIGKSDNDDKKRCVATQKYPLTCTYYNFKDDEVEVIDTIFSEKQIEKRGNNNNKSPFLIRTHEIINLLSTLRKKVIMENNIDAEKEREEIFLNDLLHALKENMINHNKHGKWDLKIDFYSRNNEDARVNMFKILDHLIRVLNNLDFNKNFTHDDHNTFGSILADIEKKLKNELESHL